jgi:hypothetical protein
MAEDSVGQTQKARYRRMPSELVGNFLQRLRNAAGEGQAMRLPVGAGAGTTLTTTT